MGEDETFRLILLVGLGILIPIGAYRRANPCLRGRSSTGARRAWSFSSPCDRLASQ